MSVCDSTILAMLIPALDGPTQPNRAWWARTFDRSQDQMDALFDLAHHERERPLIEISTLRQRPEGEGD